MRRVYREGAAQGLFNYNEIAQSCGLNRTTVQRLLACTAIAGPHSGHYFAVLETIVRAMGYELVCIPTRALQQQHQGAAPLPPS